MKDGRVSLTALKVAFTVSALAHDPKWRDRLPPELGPMTERLLEASGSRLYGGWSLRLNDSKLLHAFYRHSERSMMPGAYEGLAHRKLFMNQAVLDALEAGATQVLIVGAGFDTLCLRLAPKFPGVRFFEVDHPATSAAKARGIEAEGRPDNLRMIEADLGAVSLATVMGDHPHWSTDAASVAVAEGLLMYLTDEQIQELFHRVSACTGPRSRIAFSHLRDLSSHGGLTRMSLRVIGEPWLHGISRHDLAEYLGPLGWTVLQQDEPRTDRDLEGFAVAQHG